MIKYFPYMFYIKEGMKKRNLNSVLQYMMKNIINKFIPINQNRIIKLNLNNYKIFYHEKYLSNFINIISYNEYLNFINLNKRFYSVIDVGAYAGLFSIILSERSKIVLAIEPNEINYRLLIRNVKYNKIRNISVFKLFLSNQISYKEIYINPYNPWEYSEYPIKNWIKDEINVDTLDNLINRMKLKYVDILKIDVDGEELNVIKGCERGLEEGKIFNIIIEVHSYELLKKLIEYLKYYKYQFILKRSKLSNSIFFILFFKK